MTLMGRHSSQLQGSLNPGNTFVVHLYAQKQKITPGIQAIALVLTHSINISIRLLFCDDSKLIFTVCRTFFRVLCVCYSLNPHRDSML